MEEITFMVSVNKIDVVHNFLWPDDDRLFDPRDFEYYHVVTVPGRLMPPCEARDLMTQCLEKALRKNDIVMALKLFTYLTTSTLKIRERYDLLVNLRKSGMELKNAMPSERALRWKKRHVGVFSFTQAMIIPESADNIVKWLRKLEDGMFERADFFCIEASIGVQSVCEKDRPEWAKETE